MGSETKKVLILEQVADIARIIRHINEGYYTDARAEKMLEILDSGLAETIFKAAFCNVAAEGKCSE